MRKGREEDEKQEEKEREESAAGKKGGGLDVEDETPKRRIREREKE